MRHGPALLSNRPSCVLLLPLASPMLIHPSYLPCCPTLRSLPLSTAAFSRIDIPTTSPTLCLASPLSHHR